jgi:acyl-CoA reductase-like NAD-dependent aldehyde dehydrogenase
MHLTQAGAAVAMLKRDTVRKISFTGSTRGGSMLSRYCVATLVVMQ